MSYDNSPFRRVGTPLLTAMSAQACTSQGVGTLGTVYQLESAYSQFGMRVKLTGPGTSGECRLMGALAPLSTTPLTTATGLVPLTTWLGSVDSSDATLWITGKPVTAVTCQVTTPSSSNTSWTVYIAGVL
jgi:hypothetical protein